MTKKVNVNLNEADTVGVDFGYYSKVLNKPFDTFKELRDAENEYT